MTAERLANLIARVRIARDTYDYWRRQASTATGGDLADRMSHESWLALCQARAEMNAAADELVSA